MNGYCLKNIFYFLFLLSAISSCSGDGWNQLIVTGIKDPAQAISPAEIYSINIENNQLIIQGKNLEGVTYLQLREKTQELGETFKIINKETDKIIALATKNLSLALDSLFSLVLSDAHGEQVFTITFSLGDEKIDVENLTTSVATPGQILKWDGANWIPSFLSGLTYIDSWDADTNTPDLLSFAGLPGSFFIVDTPGVTELDGISTWEVGDWAVLNENYEWTRVPQVSGVTEFNGRKGEVNPEVGDYGLWQMADVDLLTTPPTDGQVLRYDILEEKWLPRDTDTLDPSDIPNLHTNKITDGTFHVDRIPNLHADKIDDGVFHVNRIPNLPANKITSGILDLAQIPTIPRSKLSGSGGASVIGRSHNNGGPVEDIIALSDNQVLRRSGGVLGFGQITGDSIVNGSIGAGK